MPVTNLYVPLAGGNLGWNGEGFDVPIDGSANLDAEGIFAAAGSMVASSGGGFVVLATRIPEG